MFFDAKITLNVVRGKLHKSYSFFMENCIIFFLSLALSDVLHVNGIPVLYPTYVGRTAVFKVVGQELIRTVGRSGELEEEEEDKEPLQQWQPLGLEALKSAAVPALKPR